jgi:acid phosphatase type 7
MKNLESKILIIFLIQFNFSFAQIYITPKTPTRIILNLTEHPATSLAVTWRTSNEVIKPEVQIAEATDWTEFTARTKSMSVKNTKMLTDKKIEVFEHSAIMNELNPNTLYVYRVGGDSIWSEWNQFRTAKDSVASFRFVYFGDPQNDLKQHCSRIFREAFINVPNAAFWLFAGDLITEPEDELYDEFFYAGGFIFGTTPLVIVPGNHDIEYLMQDGKFVRDSKGNKKRGTKVSELWREQFTLPENSLAGYEETSYTLDYQGVRFIIINSTDKKNLSRQNEWIEKYLANNPNKWTIVSFHHPFYSSAEDRDDNGTRNAYQKLFDKYNVDLVLSGHDHSYARSYKIKNGVRVKDSDNGTIYVVSVSGPKMYPVNSNYNQLMAKKGGYVQLFQTISIKDNTLIFEAYTVTGNLYDSFKVTK